MCVTSFIVSQSRTILINVLIRQAYFPLVVYLTFITKRALKATIPFYSNAVKLLRKSVFISLNS